MYEKRTDLAIEVRESFPEDKVEIEGVALTKEQDKQGNLMITTVEIKNKSGARQMKKPIGTYVTLEFEWGYDTKCELERRISLLGLQIQKILERMLCQIKKKAEKKCHTALITGLGNRFATPDALGPYVLENIQMNRHIYQEFPEESTIGEWRLCGIAPGVMSQTGMESSEILRGIIEKIRPDIVIVIDSLASRSVDRLCRTIQITDTGISPGAGIGNNRNQINQTTMGVPVIAIGVPTVVDAGTIIYETLENALSKSGCTEQEIVCFFENIMDQKKEKLFVTPKDIDEEIRRVGKTIAKGITEFAVSSHTLS